MRRTICFSEEKIKALQAGIKDLEIIPVSSRKTVPYCCGDRLYIKEPFAKVFDEILYRADADEMDKVNYKFYPATRMSVEDSRYIMRVTAARVKPLNEVSEREAYRAGFGYPARFTFGTTTFRNAMKWYWRQTYQNSYQVHRNPNVWVLNIEVRQV